jgi:hypothetical protein
VGKFVQQLPVFDWSLLFPTYLITARFDFRGSDDNNGRTEEVRHEIQQIISRIRTKYLHM